MTAILRGIALVLIGLVLVIAAFQAAKGQLVLTGFQRMTMVTVLLWVGIDPIRVGYELEKLRPAILMHWAVPKRKQFTGLPDVGT
jgi:hypothetical protein